MDSVSALSYTSPIDAAMSSSASVSAKLTDLIRDPASLWWTSPSRAQ